MLCVHAVAALRPNMPLLSSPGVDPLLLLLLLLATCFDNLTTPTCQPIGKNIHAYVLATSTLPADPPLLPMLVDECHNL